jgi:hypothetical protein
VSRHRITPYATTSHPTQDGPKFRQLLAGVLTHVTPAMTRNIQKPP